MNTDFKNCRASKPLEGSSYSSPGGGGLRSRGFTIVELLVVISIIALLASLTVGLSSVASRKGKESRLKGERDKLVTAIDSYHAAIGSYPRDNAGTPSLNQLYYELSGTFYHRGDRDGFFSLPNRDQRIPSRAIADFFHAPGFANSVAVDSGEKPKFTDEFKPDQVKQISRNPDFEVLVAPVKGPAQFAYGGRILPLAIQATDGTQVNPWLYDSSSAIRNNRDGYDLWVEVVIGRGIFRFSNWENGPTRIGEAP